MQNQVHEMAEGRESGTSLVELEMRPTFHTARPGERFRPHYWVEDKAGGVPR